VSVFRAFKPVLLLALLTSAFYADGVFLGRSLSGAGNLYNDSLYRSIKPRGWHYIHLADPTPYWQIAPWGLYSAHMLWDGEVPLWNPYSGTGTPFLANWQTTVFSPLKFPLYLWPRMSTLEYIQVLKIFLAGFFILLLCRKMGLSHAGSLVSGITYAFGGGMVSSFRYMEANTYVLLPLLFYGLIPCRSSRLLTTVSWFGPVMAILILSGHPGATFYTFLGGTVYICVERDKRRVFVGIMSLLFGLFLSSIALLPFLEYFLTSGLTYHSIKPLEGLSLYLFLTRLTALLVPIPLEHYPFPYMAYCGLVPLAFALLNIMGKKRAIPLLGVFLLGIFIFLRLPPISWLGDLPLFRHSKPQYAIGLVCFSISILAGMGFDEWIEKRKEKNVILVRIGLIVLALSVLLSLLSPFGIMNYAPETLLTEWVRLIAPRLLLAILFSIGVVVIGMWNVKKNMASKIFIAMTIFDLFLAGFRYNSPTDYFDFPETEPIQWLKARPGLFRVLGMEGSSNAPNTGLVHGITDLRINDPMLPSRYLRTMIAVDPSGIIDIGPIPTRYSSQLLDILNVRYLIACTCRVSGIYNEYSNDIFKLPWHTLPVPGKKWKEAYRDKDTVIYENTHVFPRAFVLYDVRLTKGEGESFSALNAKDIDLRNTAILEVSDLQEQEVIRKGLSKGKNGKKEEIVIVSYSPHRAKLAVTLSSAGVLVLGDAYDRNWKVLVDGQKDRMYPADYLLRGVVLKGGKHEIEFFYDPWSFKVGALISLFFLMLWCVLVAFNRVYFFKKADILDT